MPAMAQRMRETRLHQSRRRSFPWSNRFWYFVVAVLIASFRGAVVSRIRYGIPGLGSSLARWPAWDVHESHPRRTNAAVARPSHHRWSPLRGEHLLVRGVHQSTDQGQRDTTSQTDERQQITDNTDDLEETHSVPIGRAGCCVSSTTRARCAAAGRLVALVEILT